MNSTTISTDTPWFKIWLAAFGDETSGIWEWDQVRIPYKKAVEKIGGFSIRTIIGATNDHTPRYDILGKLTDPDDTFKKLLSEFSASMLVFPYLASNSRLLSQFPKDQCTLFYQLDDCEKSPFANCETPWDDYWHSRGKTRSTWARREKKLIEKSGADFVVLSKWGEIAPLLDQIYDVEASGWKGEQGSAIKQNKATHKFYTDLIKYYSENDQLRLFILVLNQEIIAFQITTLMNRKIEMLKIGYLESYSKLSPGQVLQTKILRWSFNNPDVNTFDFLGGGGAAFNTKMKWATDTEQLYTLRIFRKNVAGLWAFSRYVIGPKIKKLIIHSK